MSLRLKLLLLGLATLVLPFAGCQYAREMEAALREGEQQALATMARTLAASLQGRTDLLYRAAHDPGPELAGAPDLQPILLASAPFLDGNADEWPRTSLAWRTVTHGEASLRMIGGVHERTLYLLLEVHDKVVVFDAPQSDPLDSSGFGDRVWLAFDDPAGSAHQVFIGSTGPGPVRARRIELREYGRRVAVQEPRIEGAWGLMPGGYRIELRIPLSMLGLRFGVLVDDRDTVGAEPESFGTLDRQSLAPQARLIAAAPELNAYLAQFMQPGLRITVVNVSGAPLSLLDQLGAPLDSAAERGILSRLYRRVLERRGDRRYVDANARIDDLTHAHAIGSLQVVQTADRWLTLRDHALTKLLNFTLLTSAGAVLLMFSFAGWLAWRLARLRRASETALTREGLVTTFPETNSGDELGDVARSFATLLARLDEYTSYLRTLAGKLAHEIRTPLTIVRSSLENLESEATTAAARTYAARAREGSDRLHAILLAMGAATRVEEAIGAAERTRFDLTALLASAVESYRIAFPQRVFVAELPGEAVELSGAPDLILQMLDKLIDNAVDFSPEAGRITVRLRLEPAAAVVEVDNPGPTLPPEIRSRLFESLWQSRPGSDSRPHFGLGLYIVRLIAHYHGGSAAASDLPDGSGARFSVRLPR
ncbi:MAG TPA: ATP-binding protein [Steroidobacteraceae bacterium]|nr:ATP-binding protein [Steroidobacteraceae bacterium]